MPGRAFTRNPSHTCYIHLIFITPKDRASSILSSKNYLFLSQGAAINQYMVCHSIYKHHIANLKIETPDLAQGMTAGNSVGIIEDAYRRPVKRGNQVAPLDGLYSMVLDHGEQTVLPLHLQDGTSTSIVEIRMALMIMMYLDLRRKIKCPG